MAIRASMLPARRQPLLEDKKDGDAYDRSDN
jgi:hypothetical protein